MSFLVNIINHLHRRSITHTTMLQKCYTKDDI
jgi:hypothetical protein